MTGIGGLALVFAASALASGVLIWLLQPLLERHALAQPNARSSHKTPTPQGGGIAVIAATVGVVAAAILLGVPGFGGHSLWLVLAATVFIALVGAIDDVRPIAVLPRLMLQAIAVAIVLAALPDDLRIVPFLPGWLERALLGRRHALVRQSDEFHGRHRLDDGRRGGAAHRRPRPVRPHGGACRATPRSLRWRCAAP